MRRPLFSLVFILLSVAFANSSNQDNAASNAKSDAAALAAGKATAELNEKSTEIDKTIQNASPDIQSKVNSLHAPTITVPTTVALEDSEHRKALAEAVHSFFSYAEAKERTYSRLSLVLIFISAGLALTGSIASFMSKNKMAGIISLIVAAVVALSNAYPVSPRADFYGDLKTQAKVLLTECQLENPYTETLYKSDISQYELLLLAERDRPSLGNYQNPAHDLNEKMKTLSITANNVDTAKAAANQIEFPTSK